MSIFGLANLLIEPDIAQVSVLFDGFTGQDGVCFQLDPTNAVRIDIADLDATYDLADGSSIEALAQGTVNGQPGQGVGTLHCDFIGVDGCEITVDFSSVGATTHRVVVFNQGTVIANISGHSGTVATAAQMPNSFGWGRVDNASSGTVEWSAPIQIAIGGGPTITGDKLRVYAESPTGAMTVLEDVCLSFNGTPDVVILNVVVQNPGDVNCDGAVAMLDTGAFVLALLDPSGYAVQYAECDVFNADMNTDGNIDGRDIQLFVQKVLNP